MLKPIFDKDVNFFSKKIIQCAKGGDFKNGALLSVTLELHSPTILFVIISGYNVPLRLLSWFVVVFPKF